MVEIRGIPMEQGNNCIRITEQICALAGMTNDNIEEIAQRIKNHKHVKKVGDTSEFLFGIYWWTWKTSTY